MKKFLFMFMTLFALTPSVFAQPTNVTPSETLANPYDTFPTLSSEDAFALLLIAAAFGILGVAFLMLPRRETANAESGEERSKIGTDDQTSATPHAALQRLRPVRVTRADRMAPVGPVPINVTVRSRA